MSAYPCHIVLGNLTNLSDARYAAAAGFHMISFCFDPGSAHYVAPVKAKEMLDWISGPEPIASFGSQEKPEILAITEALQTDLICIDSLPLLDELKDNFRVILKVQLASLTEPTLHTLIEGNFTALWAIQLVCDPISLVDHQTLVQQAINNYKVILELNADAPTMVQQVKALNPFALFVNGGEEDRPGIRDFDKLEDLKELLEV